MFGLKKLKFKTKVNLITVIVIIILMGVVYLKNTTSISVVKIDDWVLVKNTDEGDWYYKSNSINIDDQTNIIKVWVKIVYTDKGKQEFMETHKENRYKDIDRSLSMVSINYKRLIYQENRVVYYSKSDNIIGSDELSIKKDNFIPKSIGDALLNKILEDYNIKG
ncbi:MAG: hypothetical protein ACYC6G_16725 [Desulfobaccales bacterium]